MKYVEVLYNIPDIDDGQGEVYGTLHYALSISIRSGYRPGLPLTGTSGKPRKDFRDFMELRSKNEDFRNLMTLAMPAKFAVFQV
ncbi:hypothetical protein NXW13_00890, partial [Bacteroides thetaiotaomicron]|nr:hypothetical protein [Bacteroides thetaiotaomicron]